MLRRVNFGIEEGGRQKFMLRWRFQVWLLLLFIWSRNTSTIRSEKRRAFQTKALDFLVASLVLSRPPWTHIPGRSKLYGNYDKK